MLSTSSVGRHSELLAMAALIADGWCVHEATTPEAHDLLAIKGGRAVRIQVKTIKLREKDGQHYYVIRGLKNSGVAYDNSDCDAFAGVVDGRVFLTDCVGLTEYWCKAEDAEKKWRELPLKINQSEAV